MFTCSDNYFLEKFNGKSVYEITFDNQKFELYHVCSYLYKVECFIPLLFCSLAFLLLICLEFELFFCFQTKLFRMPTKCLINCVKRKIMFLSAHVSWLFVCLQGFDQECSWLVCTGAAGIYVAWIGLLDSFLVMM